jgi:restriction system protein
VEAQVAIPDFQSITLPLLKYLGDGKEHTLQEVFDVLAKQFRLAENERHQMLLSSRQAIFENRVGWARTYMKKAGLIVSTGRGAFRICDAGAQVLPDKPAMLDIHLLEQFPAFLEFWNLGGTRPRGEGGKPTSGPDTPEESLGGAYNKLRAALADEVFQRVESGSASAFERTVINLLVKMGYAGTREDAAQVIGKRGDEGTDGIIKEDRLGLDIIYVQAKRWEGTVGRPEVQKFAGALLGQGAKKGIFITTAVYSK